jgi:serine/threonine-protein kinase
MAEETLRDNLPVIGALVDRKYRVEDRIGAGGMGVVLSASHVHLGERVALKLVRPTKGLDLDAYERLFREARIAGRIRSEHVARVFDLGLADNGMPYIAMEYLEGTDLAWWITERGPSDPAEAVELLLQAIEGVAEAHALGVIHRDLKPANLFLTRRSDGSPCIKVLDFGVSKMVGDAATPDAPVPPWVPAQPPDDAPAPEGHTLRVGVSPAASTCGLTGSRTRIGSPRYAAPEQMRSARDVDVRADVWAFGAILFELLTGHPAFDGSSLDEIRRAVASLEPATLERLRRDLPRGLADVVRRCLQKDRAARYADVAQLALALAPFVPGGGERAARVARILHRAGMSPATEASVVLEPSSTRTPRRRRWVSATPILAAALIVGGLATVSAVGRQPRATRATPQSASAAASAPAPLASEEAYVDTRPRAVIGFAPPRNLDGRAEADWISPLLAEMVGTELAAGSRFRLVAQSRVARARRELSLADEASYPPATLARLRGNLGCDYFLSGSYVTLDGESSVRADLTLQDARTGVTVAQLAVHGSDDTLPEMAATIAASVRARLGAPEPPADEREAARAANAGGVEASRLFMEGSARSSAFDYVGARDAFERAVAGDPACAFTHYALAGVLETLGDSARAAEEARMAYEVSRKLPRAFQLAMEGRYRALTRDWGRAVEVYRTLFEYFPDDVDYAIAYGKALTDFGRAQDALGIVERVRASQPADPQIDLYESDLGVTLGDPDRALRAAEAAAKKAEESSQTTALAEALRRIASLQQRAGATKAAIAAYGRALALFEQLDDRMGQSSVLSSLGELRVKQGDVEGGVEMQQKALCLARETGSARDITERLDALARTRRLPKKEAAKPPSPRAPASTDPLLNVIGGELFRERR